MDDNPFSRRRVLELGGAGSIAALAGCNALGEAPTNQQDDEPAEDGGSGETSAVTVAAQADEEERQALQQEYAQTQQEIQQQVDDGEIDQEEAQQRMRTAQQEARQGQQELIDAAVQAIEDHAGDAEGLTIAEMESGAGALLVEGDAESLLALLDLSQVAALLPSERFEQVQQQQQQQGQSGQ